MRLADIRQQNIIEEVLPVEYEEPSGRFTFAGKEYPFWGSLTGRASTENYELGKFNRYAKLGNIADKIVKDFSGMISSEASSVNGRCAYACMIMMMYGVRVGNEDSAEGYESGLEKNAGQFVHTYGTTTLLNEHISFHNNTMFLNFVGKEQVSHSIQITDPFFQKYGRAFWRPEAPKEKWLGVDYSFVFDFVKDNVGPKFIPKDFRTFCANTTGWGIIEKFLDRPTHPKKSDAKKEIAYLVELTAKRLGNTPGIAKRNYLDSRMLDWFLGQRYKEEKE
jgi:DNA topoisomerase IB